MATASRKGEAVGELIFHAQNYANVGKSFVKMLTIHLKYLTRMRMRMETQNVETDMLLCFLILNLILFTVKLSKWNIP